MANTSRGWTLYVVLALVVVFAALFVIFLVSSSSQSATGEPLSADSYRDRVTTLLANADPVRGAQLVETHGCTACHREGAVNGIAPEFEGIAERAEERRPPMPAAAYIYESIAYPAAYLVEGYPNTMPQNYEGRIPDADIGDMIAFLQTEDAR